MPRRPRMPGEYLHIIVRGIGKQILFEDSFDREKYLSCLQKYSDETEIRILAYCLMENHVHLLVRDSQSAIALFMKKMGVSYAQYFNWKYDRVGHLFQDRYKSENIINEAYLLSVFRYILNNPVKAGICRAEEYVWSSYHEYGKENCLTDTEMLCKLIGDKSAFQQFICQDNGVEHMEDDVRKRDDAWALQRIQELLHVVSGTELQKYEKKKRDQALALLKLNGLSIRQIERLTGINRSVVQKSKVSMRTVPIDTFLCYYDS